MYVCMYVCVWAPVMAIAGVHSIGHGRSCVRRRYAVVVVVCTCMYVCSCVYVCMYVCMLLLSV